MPSTLEQSEDPFAVALLRCSQRTPPWSAGWARARGCVSGTPSAAPGAGTFTTVPPSVGGWVGGSPLPPPKARDSRGAWEEEDVATPLKPTKGVQATTEAWAPQQPQAPPMVGRCSVTPG